MYKQDANGYWSTNPDNPNAERFTSDGRPVATIGYDNQKTGTHYEGWGTPEQAQAMRAVMNDPAAEENLIKSWLQNGFLNHPYSQFVTNNNSNPVYSAATTDGSSFVQKLKQAVLNPMSTADIQKQMQANSDAWNRTTDPAEREWLHDKNIRLAALIGATYDPSGTWTAAGSASGYDFLNNQGQAVSRDGSLHVSVNGQPSADVPVYQGTAFGNLDEMSKRFGVNFNIDPNGIVTVNGKVVKPIGYDSKGIPEVGLRDFAQAAGLKVDYNDNGKTVTISGSTQPINEAPNTGVGIGDNQGSGQGAPGTTQFPGGGSYGYGGDQGTGIQDPWAAWNSYISAHPLQQPNMIPIQQQFTPDWQSYYSQAHAQIDPLYQTQYNNLMSKQASDINAMDQKMNARGIFTSGIAQAAENDLRAKTSNSVASLFNKQMSDIEKTAQTLYNNAYKQYSQGNQFALKYNQDQLSNYLNQQKFIFSQWLQTQRLTLSQAQYALNAWDKQATMLWHNAQLDFEKYKFNNLSDYQKQTLDFNKYKFSNLSADQIATLQQNGTKIFGVDANGRPTLDALKAAGLTPVGVDANGNIKFVQTATASDADRKYALDLAKARGGWFDSDGNLIMPTEQAKHDRATEQNAADSLKLRIYDMMGFDQNGVPTLKREQLDETINKDNQMIDIARTNATNAENKTVIEGIGRQLSTVDNQINAIYNSGILASTDPRNAQAKQDAMTQLKTLSGQRDTLKIQLAGFTNQGFYNYYNKDEYNDTAEDGGKLGGLFTGK
ncbi:hypothetical protein SD70_27155 [Gordoniibacillus kamchatkensis]|uniref:Uncharacterized protein n=2 Tax=Gordoniibacillus kamchatkensis TaxID=1590651 RepID=A0ABR5AB83_9BACL|nr:hypothetical protein SD70_27155 [Paenibacillus sp. VKM B-2647]